MTEVGPWYESLRFPRLRPPNWLFGPAWTLIFALIATAGVLGLAGCAERRRAAANSRRCSRSTACSTSPGARCSSSCRRPDWAFYELLPFWLSIVALIVFVAPFSARAAALLAPYLAWVTFAGWLNWRIVQLNAPFRPRRGAVAMSVALATRGLDLALALIALEAMALLAWRWATGAGPRALIANLAAGGLLLLVARELAAGDGLAAGAALTAALVAHGFDLAARWERKPKRERPRRRQRSSLPAPEKFFLVGTFGDGGRRRAATLICFNNDFLRRPGERSFIVRAKSRLTVPRYTGQECQPSFTHQPTSVSMSR